MEYVILYNQMLKSYVIYFEIIILKYRDFINFTINIFLFDRYIFIKFKRVNYIEYDTYKIIMYQMLKKFD